MHPNNRAKLYCLCTVIFILVNLENSSVQANNPTISQPTSKYSRTNPNLISITKEELQVENAQTTTSTNQNKLTTISNEASKIVYGNAMNNTDITTSTETSLTTTTALPKYTGNTCPMPDDLDDLTQNQFSTILTNDCRYDKLTKPHSKGPLIVTLQIDIRHIEAAEQLLKVHVNVQYSYLDERLKYETLSPRRGHMLGEDVLKSRIWVPHLFLMNEKDVSIMGLGGKDVFVAISPKGEVIYSYRMAAMIYCWMNLKKFPFDEQTCNLHFQSWTYNASQLLLQWEQPDPVTVASPLHLTEFTLEDFLTLEDLKPAPIKTGSNEKYSALTFRFKIAREVGFYIIDYFIPSIMLVSTSWVTFWLQADNTPARVALGTSTMLSFITLASGQTKTLPKVSYIKVSEIWFLGCSLFIFASMVEFAFVNIIWRRRKKVELKKVNSKYILKSTLTPRLARKELQQSHSISNLYKTRSCTSLNTNQPTEDNNETSYNNYLTVHSFTNIPKITTQSDENLISDKQESSTSIEIPEPAENTEQPLTSMWTTMTPHEVANWIDKKSRLVFPCAFLVFNVFFWTMVFCF